MNEDDHLSDETPAGYMQHDDEDWHSVGAEKSEKFNAELRALCTEMFTDVADRNAIEEWPPILEGIAFAMAAGITAASDGHRKHTVLLCEIAAETTIRYCEAIVAEAEKRVKKGRARGKRSKSSH